MEAKRQHFAVVGSPISHSLSPILFENYTTSNIDKFYYTRILATETAEIKELIDFFNIKGLNITSPFKKDILRLSSSQSPEVSELKVANTLILKNKFFFAYNTDIVGVEIPLKRFIKKSHKSALILGAGGASKAVIYALKKLGIKNIYITNRTSKKSKASAKKNNIQFVDFGKLDTLQYNIIINTIPFKINLFKEFKFNNSTIIFDANYKDKPLYEVSKKQKVLYINGIEWLIEQGKKSYELMTGILKNDIKINKSELKTIKNKSKTIAIIGPMGSWKSSVGKLLSKKLAFDFVDIDAMIEENEKISTKEIFKTKGEKHFRTIEKKMLKKSLKRKNIIISTGGGIIKDKENINLLKNKSWNILLYASAEESFSRININKRPLLKGKNVLKILKDLLKERKDLYFLTSDLIINTNYSSSKKISNILYEDYNSAFQV